MHLREDISLLLRPKAHKICASLITFSIRMASSSTIYFPPSYRGSLTDFLFNQRSPYSRRRKKNRKLFTFPNSKRRIPFKCYTHFQLQLVSFDENDIMWGTIVTFHGPPLSSAVDINTLVSFVKLVLIRPYRQFNLYVH